MHLDGSSDSAGWAEPFRGEWHDRSPGDYGNARLIPVSVFRRLCFDSLYAISTLNVVVAEFGSKTNLRITKRVISLI